jgi:NADH-quinone oxidoreductase subunit L
VIHALHGEQDIRNMGGLRKELPITYWTFLIGSIAIAGVPPLAGFFSKDEILFETLSHGYTALWVIGILTSFLTATYMFRLVFLTFHGERRHDAPAAADAHGHAAHDAHGHGGHGHDSHGHGHLHDAPPAMAIALVVLAIGSVAAGWVGIPHAIGGGNHLHTWLEPAFTVASGSAEAAAAGAAAPAGEGEVANERLEVTLMAVSSAIGLLGIAVAFGIWIKRRDIADAAARSLAPIHKLLLNKYYVDEIYEATIVTPVQAVSREGLWRGVDVGLIDGAVNGVGAIVHAGSMVLRRLQTGSVRAYAGSLFIGVVLMLGYYLWR